MPTAEIIRQIDAYLSCLRDARDLLSTPAPAARRGRATGGKKTVKRKRTASPVSSRPRIQENKSRSNGVVHRPKKMEIPVDPVSPVPGPVARPAEDSVQPPLATQPSALQGTVEKEIPSGNKTKPPAKSPHPRGMWRTLKTRPGKAGPATALAGAPSARVVVVSAEELKREREQSASREVRRPPVSAARLTGKLAFEALFKD